MMLAHSQGQVKKLLRRVFGRVRYQVEGTANLPKMGPAIIIMNHTGWEEILLAIMAVPRPLRILGLRELMLLDRPSGRARIFSTNYAEGFGPVRRGMTILLGNLFGALIRRQLSGFGFIPMAVFTEAWPPTLGSNGIREAVRAVEQGDLLLVFPEGGYNRDGVMGPFKKGIGLMLRLLHKRGVQAPIIPAAQQSAGSISFNLGNRYIPRMVFGQAMVFQPEDYSSPAFDEIVIRALQVRIEELMKPLQVNRPA